MTSIRFYSSTDDHFQFSNYYPTKIVIKGITYPSSEHYYQSQKFIYDGASKRSIEYGMIVTTAKTPNISRELASQKIKGGYKWRTDLNEIIRQHRDVMIDKDWDARKDNVMRKVVYQKFVQHENLRKILLETGNRELIEASPRDSYWGEGKNKNGLNMLGTILMEVRYLLSRGTHPLHSPTTTSFWVIPGVLLSSAYPSDQDAKERNKMMKNIVKSGVEAIVDLMESSEKENLDEYQLPPNFFYTNIPIKDRGVIADDALRCVVKGILLLIVNKKGVLVHCFGGKGRTGTVATALLCELYDISASESIKTFTDLFKTRENKGKRGLNLLTAPQRNQLMRMYP